MSDWTEATDPAPRRELTDAENRRLQALQKFSRKKGYGKGIDTVMSYRVDPAFDKPEGL